MANKQVKRLSEAQMREIAARFRALSQPLRLRIINELMGGEQNVSTLVRRTGENQSNVSKHLAALHGARLLDRRREGLNIFYSVADDRILQVCEIMCGGLKPAAGRSNGSAR